MYFIIMWRIGVVIVIIEIQCSVDYIVQMSTADKIGSY